MEMSEEEYYREKIIKIIKGLNGKKGELLYRIMVILEILPRIEYERIYDFLSELYFS